MTEFNIPMHVTQIECQSCKTLREYVEYLKNQNQQLTETLIALVKPKELAVASGYFPTNPVQQPAIQRWSKMKSELEKADRETARLKEQSPVIAKSDAILENALTEKLEAELEIK